VAEAVGGYTEIFLCIPSPYGPYDPGGKGRKRERKAAPARGARHCITATVDDYSGLIPAAAAILRYFSISLFWKLASVSMLDPTMSVATSIWRFL
jgi:hypothetical protein